jgi:hypothetical protein
MRATDTLDPDVDRLIRDAMRVRGISFKEALNEAARSGLRGNARTRAGKFTQKSYRMGEAWRVHRDKALAVADAVRGRRTQPEADAAQMILLDANILIYAVNADAPSNRKAKACWNRFCTGRRRWDFRGTYFSHSCGSALDRVCSGMSMEKASDLVASSGTVLLRYRLRKIYRPEVA